MSDGRPWEAVGLTQEEYRAICAELDREPNHLELGLYGLMWSEHCSYKSSRRHLDRLPTEGPQVLQGPGENAGVVDIGEDMAVAFRIESHNHPSAIEPVQGAATGIGGILRDIFAMGARPIALLDSLRFGDPADARVRYLFEGVVAGISAYGNCVGVPTVGGEIVFDDAYRDNPLVNVMCVGLVERARLVRGTAAGTGNVVLLVGAPTGRDGIHGASLLASREFDENPGDMRPAVQVGDPFREKLLIEACLEAVQSDDVIGVNDLGAAGLTSACSETAARAGSGMQIDVGRVPRREPGMNPYEVMLSESQERMLVIVRPEGVARVQSIFRRWDLAAVEIGKVTGDRCLRVFEEGREVAAVPVQSLTDGAPTYDRPWKSPEVETSRWEPGIAQGPDPGDALTEMIGHPAFASRRPVFEQYDHMVGINTVLAPGAADAAVMRVKGTDKGIACVADGDGYLCALDPRRGAERSVAESYRNLSSVGARPLAITNCLNFGNPEIEEIMGSFVEVIEGMRTACLALDTPVTGGNVSFYNETRGRQVHPTPVIGMIGLLDDVERHACSGFLRAGERLFILGRGGENLGASQYLRLVHGISAGPVPAVDYPLERSVGLACRRAIAEGIVRTAHDVSHGGLGVALAECALTSPCGLGAAVDLSGCDDPEVAFFAEDGSRILVAVSPEFAPRLREIAAESRCPLKEIGRVGGDHLEIALEGSRVLRSSVQELRNAWERGLE